MISVSKGLHYDQENPGFSYEWILQRWGSGRQLQSLLHSHEKREWSDSLRQPAFIMMIQGIKDGFRLPICEK